MRWRDSCTLSLLSAIVAAAQETNLHGRYLTISDLHPDWHYQHGADVGEACHSRKERIQNTSERRNGKAGYWGTPVSDCDTPSTLIDATFHDLAQKWTDKLDFVIVMGDLARHDIENLSRRFQDAFPGVAIVPSVGNNDVFPHNIMTNGPSRVLSGLADVWADFIPEEQYHTFARGGYYSKEVIPGKLVVVALNTIFWFDSNKILNGCPVTKRHRPADPGTEQLDWLAVSLSRWRARGIQVILSGHVPPGDYYPDCYSRFAEIALAYQDTIVSSIFGHKNFDYFLYFSHSQLFNSKEEGEGEEADIISAFNADSLPGELRSAYSALPKKPSAADYMFLNVAPSVIPTYLPSYRIWTYNTTGTPYIPSMDISHLLQNSDNLEIPIANNLLTSQTSPIISTSLIRRDSDQVQTEVKKKRKHKRRRHRKHRKRKPEMPRYVSPESPSRSNRFLTTLGYTQYTLALEEANQHDGFGPSGKPANTIRPWPVYEVEYTTYTPSNLRKILPEIGVVSDFQRKSDNFTPYKLDDLTIDSWLDLAHRLSHSKKLWQGFEQRIFGGALA